MYVVVWVIWCCDVFVVFCGVEVVLVVVCDYVVVYGIGDC